MIVTYRFYKQMFKIINVINGAVKDFKHTYNKL